MRLSSASWPSVSSGGSSAAPLVAPGPGPARRRYVQARRSTQTPADRELMAGGPANQAECVPGRRRRLPRHRLLVPGGGDVVVEVKDVVRVVDVLDRGQARPLGLGVGAPYT